MNENIKEIIKEIEDNDRVKTSGDYSFQAGIDLCLEVLNRYLHKPALDTELLKAFNKGRDFERSCRIEINEGDEKC